ncbi:hypothetical protein D8S78_20820 [Natrialba swarupiae]|nr:hypothetical protein [Natrialba swarupiae]
MNCWRRRVGIGYPGENHCKSLGLRPKPGEQCDRGETDQYQRRTGQRNRVRTRVVVSLVVRVGLDDGLRLLVVVFVGRATVRFGGLIVARPSLSSSVCAVVSLLLAV